MSRVRTASCPGLAFGSTSPATLVAAAALLLSAVSVTPAKADGATGAGLQPLQVAYAAGALAQSPMPASGQSLVTPVVGRDCRICRRVCYRDYRIDCYGNWCRKAFTRCMRGCWYEFCR